MEKQKKNTESEKEIEIEKNHKIYSHSKHRFFCTIFLFRVIWFIVVYDSL